MGQNASINTSTPKSKNRFRKLNRSEIQLDDALIAAIPKMLKLIKRYPIVVFAEKKCTVCRKIKVILDEYEGCVPYVVELEDDANGKAIANAIYTATKRKLPSIFIGGEPIGGYEDLEDLHDADHLCELLENAVLSLDTGLSTVFGQTGEATFAGGSYRFLEASFCKVNGVLATAVGYAVAWDETYKGQAVQVTYDTSIVKYEQLLQVFWQSHDPTMKVNHKLEQRTAIYVQDDLQLEVAAEAITLQRSHFGDRLNTVVLKLGYFDLAEKCEQKYYLQKHIPLFSALNITTFDEIVLSEGAAKLNGFVAGDKLVKQRLYRSICKLSLPIEAVKEIRKLLKA